MNIRKSIYCNKSVLTAILVLAAVVCGSVACKREIAEPAASPESKYSLSATAININAASPAELEKIPFIGEKLALQIVEHREQYGPFRRSEDLLLIPGISDSRFRKIRDLVRVD